MQPRPAPPARMIPLRDMTCRLLHCPDQNPGCRINSLRSSDAAGSQIFGRISRQSRCEFAGRLAGVGYIRSLDRDHARITAGHRRRDFALIFVIDRRFIASLPLFVNRAASVWQHPKITVSDGERNTGPAGFWKKRPACSASGNTNPTRQRGECRRNPRWRFGLVWLRRRAEVAFGKGVKNARQPR